MRQYRILESTTRKGKITYRVQLGSPERSFWLGCSVEFYTMEEAKKCRDNHIDREVVSTRVVG